MKKLKKTIILGILFTFILLLGSNVFATSLQPVEFSDSFKKWLELSDEEKKQTIPPNMYSIRNFITTSKSPFLRSARSYANTTSRYNLKDIIPDNLFIKNQMSTQYCWAFSALSSLETNLALADYKKGAPVKVYDYSERHMNYATSKTFANNTLNSSGYNRDASDGGQWYIASSYLTNGSGAVLESDMPFQNNNSLINISEIQNKKVASQIYDTVVFPDYQAVTDVAQSEEIKNQIKQHIQNYGSVFAAIHGNSSSNAFACYNNTTGALYCNTSTGHRIDHAVSIVGWDDNYSIENFSSSVRPTHNGAWIVRNSWGTKQEYPLSDLKQLILNTYPNECAGQGWYTASDIPNAFIEHNGYTIEGEMAYLPIGDNGFMYVSYDDVNISKSLSGIVKAADKVDYENIYQYDEFSPCYMIKYESSKIFLGNIFNKKTSTSEYLTQVALYAPETYTCRVYVNPNATSIEKKDLQLVPLKAGESETFSAGYHTLEFANPIEITGSTFFVVIEIQTNNPDTYISVETKIPQLPTFDNVKVESRKCFITTEDSSGNFNDWLDLRQVGDSSIKAFTVSKLEDNSLKNIEIQTPPTKTSYVEGENFNSAGMVVKANYNNGTSQVLDSSSYNITNGSNLKKGQTSVTISYEDKTVLQPITVVENTSNKDDDSNPPKGDDDNVNKPSQGDDDKKDDGDNKPSQGDDDKKDDGSNKPSQGDDNKEDINIKAQNSNFDKANVTVKNVQAYYNTKDSKKNYVLVKIAINQISKVNTNDSFEYYYYLSSNANEKNITNWVKIENLPNSNNQLQFEIDSRKIANYAELSNEGTVYIYIKEVAKKGGNQSILISNPLKVESNVEAEIFVDGIRKVSVGSSNNNNNSNINNGSSNKVPNDNTTSSDTLPQTGITVTVSIFIIISLCCGLVLYIRYKKLSNKIK